MLEGRTVTISVDMHAVRKTSVGESKDLSVLERAVLLDVERVDGSGPRPVAGVEACTSASIGEVAVEKAL